MKKFYKIINGEYLIKDKNQIKVIRNGFRIFNPNEDVLLEEGWLEYLIPNITEEQILLMLLEKEITKYKNYLEQSDYKIIKCIESFLCGEELPYNIKELHQIRNEYRTKINNYEHLTN